MNGTKFDSSFDRRTPFTFELGVGQVIPGWDKGLIGVCKGEEKASSCSLGPCLW